MRIVHASDTHGRPSIVKAACSSDVDLIILTGDILSNRGRVQRTNYRIIREEEERYQGAGPFGWARKYAKKWAAAAGDTPILTVRGNHDFISPARWLRYYGATVYEITDDEPCIDLLGKTFAGFRQIPYIIGEWAGEVGGWGDEIKVFYHLVDNILRWDPDILVTHAPPYKILDEHGYGIQPLTTALMYREHNVTHHFFGHAHGSGGQVTNANGITFSNAACTALCMEI